MCAKVCAQVAVLKDFVSPSEQSCTIHSYTWHHSGSLNAVLYSIPFFYGEGSLGMRLLAMYQSTTQLSSHAQSSGGKGSHTPSQISWPAVLKSGSVTKQCSNIKEKEMLYHKISIRPMFVAY